MDKRFVTCNIKGGLGNQLFQIFATLAYGLRTQRKAVFLYKEDIGNRPSYWHSFFQVLAPSLLDDEEYQQTIYGQQSPPQIHKEPCFAHSEIPEYPDARVVVLDGYFQSSKYFEHYKKDIMRMLWLDDTSLVKLGRKSQDSDRCFKIGMHFRIGDYKPIQHFHPVLPTAYYVNALTQCLKDHGYYVSASEWNSAIHHLMGQLNPPTSIENIGEVVYLCETADLGDVECHLSVLRETFPYLTFTKGQAPPPCPGQRECDRDWQEVALLSQCDWFVIPNSTFSWWAATFSVLGQDDAEGRGDSWVYYPSVWFGPALWDHETRDLTCQQGWKRIEF